MKNCKKIAFSGSHGTGKSTICYQHCYNLKVKAKNKEIGILSEIPRKCPFPINQSGTIKTQLWIFSTHLKEEMEKEKIYDILVCDRTVVDYLAYCYFIDKQLYEYLFNLCKLHINTYAKIYFKTIKKNNYFYDDGVRDMDSEYRQNIENKMLDDYYKLNITLEMI